MPKHIIRLAGIAVVVLLIIGLGVGAVVSQQTPPPIQTQPDPDLPIPDVRVDGQQVSGDLINLLQTNGIPREQAIAVAINDLLLKGAAPRFGVVPSDEEVQAYTDYYLDLISELPPDKLAEVNEILALQDITKEGLAAGQHQATFEYSATLANVRNFLFERRLVADLTGTPVEQIPDLQTLNALKSGVGEALDQAKRNNLGLAEAEVQQFLAQERGNAVIVVNDPAQ